MVAYVREANKHGTSDGMMRPKNQPMLEGEHYNIKYTDGTSKDIYLSIRSLIIASWVDDYADATKFGFIRKRKPN